MLALALTVRHAGWIYYQGGDQLWYYTLGWLLGHWQLTQTSVGYGWSFLLAPLSGTTGPNLVSALPVIVLFNVLVLLPTAMAALYGIAARIGGRLFGYWTLLVWIAVPFIGIAYTNTGYHQRYTEVTLPQSFGLTAMSDFPGSVAVLVSCYFCMKLLLDERPELVDAFAAGVAAGVAVAIKPASVLFLVGPALGFLYRRRLLHAAMMTVALAPAALTLAVWKGRGLGNIPLIADGGTHAGALGTASGAPIGALNLQRYIHNLDWGVFIDNLDLIREHFWSVRLIEWLVIAGLIGLARASRGAFLLVGGWFFAFAIVKGSYVGGLIENASLFRLMMPAFAAFVLMLASVPLLLPQVPQRLRPLRPESSKPPSKWRWSAIAGSVLLTAVAPLIVIATARTVPGVDVATANATIVPIPANIDLGLTASVDGKRVVLRWRNQTSRGGPVFYRIWRGRSNGFTCPATPGARLCNVTLPEAGVASQSPFSERVQKGRWVYRVAVAANWLNDPTQGDPYLVSTPLAVRVR